MLYQRHQRVRQRPGIGRNARDPRLLFQRDKRPAALLNLSAILPVTWCRLWCQALRSIMRQGAFLHTRRTTRSTLREGSSTSTPERGSKPPSRRGWPYHFFKSKNPITSTAYSKIVPIFCSGTYWCGKMVRLCSGRTTPGFANPLARVIASLYILFSSFPQITGAVRGAIQEAAPTQPLDG